MLRSKYKYILGIWLVVLASLLMPSTSYALQPTPGQIGIVIVNPPGDLTIRMEPEVEEWRASVRRAAWEVYYVFILECCCDHWEEERLFRDVDELTFWISSNRHGEFEVTVPIESTYRITAVYLDLATRTISDEPPAWRIFAIFLMHVVTMLLIGGVIFLLCGYLTKRSWIVFLITNVILQAIVIFLWTFPVSWLANEAPFGLHITAIIFIPIVTAVLILMKICLELIVYHFALEERKERERDKSLRIIAFVLGSNGLYWAVFTVFSFMMPIPV